MTDKTHYVFYDNTTGEIKAQGVGGSATVTTRSSLTYKAEYADPEQHYYLAGVKTARPAATASFDKTSVTADAVTAGTPDEIVISSIASGALITVLGSENAKRGDPITATDVTHTLQFTSPGVYRVIVLDFPKLAVEQDITAT